MYTDSFVDQDNQDIAGITCGLLMKTAHSDKNRDVYLILGVQAGAFNR